MANCTVSTNLQAALLYRCERVRKPALTVLFRRGDQAFGMFLVLSGKVRLDLCLDEAGFARYYGPGALVGLPATLTRHPYSMTASVVEDAELGFVSPDTLETVVHEGGEAICHELLALLGEKVAEMQKVTSAILEDKRPPREKSRIV